jgi:Tfp pilus assembly protein PilF
MDVELLKNSFAAFSVTLAFYTALMARKERLKMFWFISGLVMGLSVINQPNVLLLLPVFALWAVGGQQKEKRELIPVLAFVLGAVLTVAPVTIRNYVAEKDFVLVTNAGGLVFFQGNNEKADGAEGTSALIELTPSQLDEQARALAEKALGKKLNSSEVSRYWLSLGLKFISHHPLSFVKLTLKKALMFWNWYEVPDNLDFYYFKRFSKVLSFLPVSFGIIAPLSMLGLVMTYGEWRKHLFGYGVIFVFMISVIMFIVTGRYRLTILPLLSVYAGHAMDVTYNLFSQKSYKKVLLWGCLFMGLWAFSNVTVLQYPQENFQVLLGNIYMERGQYDKALKEYSEALKSLPYTVSSRTAYALCLEKNNLKDAALKEYRQLLYYQMVPAVRADIYLAIGLILFDKRDRKGAREAYENALRYEENHAEALNNLAWLYLTDNEMPEARRYAEKALALRPSSPEFMDTFGMVLMKERKYKEAVEYFRRALSKMPDSAEIKQHLNDALKLSG